MALSTEGADPQELGILQQAFGVQDHDLAVVFYQISTYLALDDADALLAAMATAVSVVDTNGEPLWLLLVGPSSGSKTETIRTQKLLADKQLSDVTLAGLLSQRPGGQKSGVLAQLGDGCNSFLTISDLSSLLSRGGSGAPSISGAQQSGVFEALRDIYDGAYTRTMDRVSPSWEGRVTLLAAVTPAIDSMRNHADALGPRWVFFRLKQLDAEQRKLVSKLVATRTNVVEHRADVAELVRGVVTAARQRYAETSDLDDETMELVEQCADLATYGRATVPRDYRGQIDGETHWEEPGRLTHQLMRLARGLAALHVGDDAVRRIVRRAAVSCMPSARTHVMEALVAAENDEWLATNEIARRTHQHRQVTKRALEDWEAVGIVQLRIKQAPSVVGEDDSEDARVHDTRAREWSLADDFRDLVTTVVPRTSCLDTKWTKQPDRGPY